MPRLLLCVFTLAALGLAQDVNAVCNPAKIICPTGCSTLKGSTCGGKVNATGKCNGCPAEVTNFLCSTKVDDNTCSEAFSKDPTTDRTPFELCTWAFNHGGQCAKCATDNHGNYGNDNVTILACAKLFKPIFRRDLKSCGSFECRFSRYWVEGGQAMLQKARRDGNVWGKAKTYCTSKPFANFFRQPPNKTNPYEVCMWGWKAGGYCTQEEGSPMWNNLNASAANGCAEYLWPNFTAVAFSTEPTQKTITKKNLEQKCSGGDTCWEKGKK